MFDATVTVARRVGREPLYEAHRRHAYQRAVAAGASHRAVTLSVLALDIVLVGLAAGAWMWPRLTPLSILVGLTLLVAAYVLVERRRPMWTEPPIRPGAGHHRCAKLSRDHV